MRRMQVIVIMLSIIYCLPVFAEEKLSKSIESFDFFIDGSSSMSGGTNSELAKVLNQINEKIPNLEYPESGIHTFSPEAVVLELQSYNKSTFDAAINKLVTNFPNGSNASLGKGFDFYAPIYSNMQRKGAVIVFTDGAYGDGRDSLNETKIFYLTQPDMCLHFVSFAKSNKAQQLIDSMAAINTCSVSVKGTDLADNTANTDAFVRRVFYDAIDIPAPVIDFVMLSIPFGFNSDKLDVNTAKVADALAERLKSQPEYMLNIDGYTCTMGNVAYNLALSKRRAESVKQYIVNAGVEPSRITTSGLGIATPRYDNATRDGRSLNRRVEFTFFTPESPEAPKQ